MVWVLCFYLFVVVVIVVAFAFVKVVVVVAVLMSLLSNFATVLSCCCFLLLIGVVGVCWRLLLCVISKLVKRLLQLLLQCFGEQNCRTPTATTTLALAACLMSQVIKFKFIQFYTFESHLLLL